VATGQKDQIRGKKYRKFGRKSRSLKHHQGASCGLKNCRKLLDSRVWNDDLACYLARGD